MKRRSFIQASASAAAALLLAACGQTGESEDVETSATDAATSEAAGNTLGAPTDFEFDPVSGEFSFTATDENVAYYFVRIFQVVDGVDSVEYKATSERIAGGVTGQVTGTVDLPAMGWGTFRVMLNSYAASGSGDVGPDPVSILAEYGVGLTLERPELLAMVSGNQVEFVVDWFTLSDYYDYEYLPELKLTFYSDAELTQEVKSETVDLGVLEETIYNHPMGYNWGSSYTEDELHYYHSDGELTGFGPYVGDTDYCFTYDNFPFTLDAGTYYVTAQAISKLDYTNDSEVSTVMEITLTDEEPTEEFTTVKTELWVDPALSDIPSTKSGQKEDRVDFCGDQPIAAEITE